MSTGSKAEKYGYIPPSPNDVRTDGVLAPLVGSKCEKYGGKWPTAGSVREIQIEQTQHDTQKSQKT